MEANDLKHCISFLNLFKESAYNNLHPRGIPARLIDKIYYKIDGSDFLIVVPSVIARQNYTFKLKKGGKTIKKSIKSDTIFKDDKPKIISFLNICLKEAIENFASSNNKKVSSYRTIKGDKHE